MNRTFHLVVLLLGVVFSALGAGPLEEAKGLWAIDGDTIMVEFQGRREEVRYVSVNALRKDDLCLGEEAWHANDELIEGKAIWLKLDIQDGEYRRERNRRLLAHVFLEPVQTPSASVSVPLVAQGLARLDVRDPNDTQIREGKDFDVQHADWIIEAQLKAAGGCVGWWGERDPYRDSDLVIAAIKHWGDDETAYIVNRGAEPVDLAAGWSLGDRARNKLIFAERLIGACLLPPGGILRVHSGPIATGRGGEHTLVVRWRSTGIGLDGRYGIRKAMRPGSANPRTERSHRRSIATTIRSVIGTRADSSPASGITGRGLWEGSSSPM